MSMVEKTPEQLREEEIVRTTIDRVREVLEGLSVCTAYQHARKKFLKAISDLRP